MKTLLKLAAGLALAAGAALGQPAPASAQEVAIRDLATAEPDLPIRVVGYGLVVGLDGTGDRGLPFGASSSSMAAASVSNLLRRFELNIPPGALRLRNTAAVLVTAEIPPHLRPGGRFDVSVASLDDATSLQGGVLWMTPLVAEAGGEPVATAQGPILIAESSSPRRYDTPEASGRVPLGGVLEVELPSPAPGKPLRLRLKQPDVQTAVRIAQAIAAAFGQASARAESPGSVALDPGPSGISDPLSFLAAVETLTVVLPAPSSVVIDARSGTVVAGGTLRLGRSSVSHQGITLSIGAPPQEPDRSLERPRSAPATVEEVGTALHAAGASPEDVIAIFEALRDVGALRATVIVR